MTAKRRQKAAKVSTHHRIRHLRGAGSAHTARRYSTDSTYREFKCITLRTAHAKRNHPAINHSIVGGLLTINQKRVRSQNQRFDVQ
jgi:hypothetical protein